LGVSFGLELAQYAGEAQGAIAEPHYVLNANASGSDRVEELPLEEYLMYVSMGAHRLERICLYKSGIEIDLSS
jgi:hypothetical protein